MADASTSGQVVMNLRNRDVKKVIDSLLKYTLLVVLFATSTGNQIRGLFYVTVSHITALIVALFWAIGDLLPSISLLVLIKDVFLTNNRKETELLHFRNYTVTLTDIIIIVFTLMYGIDISLNVLCYVTNFKAEYKLFDCDSYVTTFRYAFFHLQTTVAIIYLIKPWNWSQPDLHKILSKLERVSHLSFKFIHSLVQYLDISRRSIADDQIVPREELRPVAVSSTRSRSSRNLGRATDTSTRLGEQNHVNSLIRREASSSRSTRRATSTRGNSRGSRSSTRQSVVVRMAPTRRTPRPLRTVLKGVSNFQDSTRTVNLNLNVN